MSDNCDIVEQFLELLRRSFDEVIEREKQQYGYGQKVGYGKVFGEKTSRELRKRISGESHVTKRLFRSYVDTHFDGRIDPELLENLERSFPIYREHVRKIKSYNSGQRTMTARQAVALIEKRLPTRFKLTDLNDSGALLEICDAMVDEHRLAGRGAEAVTNSLALSSYLQHAPVSDSALKSRLIATVASDGMYSAYQASNLHVLKAHQNALACAQEHHDSADIRIVKRTADHLLDELRRIQRKFDEAGSVSAMRIRATAPRSHVLLSPTMDLSVLHNGIKTLREQGAKSDHRVPDLDQTIMDFALTAPHRYLDHGHIEGAALAHLSTADMLQHEGDVEGALLQSELGLALVVPRGEQHYPVANGALCELRGDLELQQVGNVIPGGSAAREAVRWYSDAGEFYRIAGCAQRGMRVASKLDALT